MAGVCIMLNSPIVRHVARNRGIFVKLFDISGSLRALDQAYGTEKSPVPDDTDDLRGVIDMRHSTSIVIWRFV